MFTIKEKGCDILRETYNLEFKESITDSFLKTVSAYANYRDGQILFGVNDAGTAIGLSNPSDAALRIENKINDSIFPCPEFIIDISEKTGVITLTVKEGDYKPYYYKSRAYRRNDSATVEVDTLELSRLILEGSRQTFDAIPTGDRNLSFQVLEQWVADKMGVPEITIEILKTLELCDKKGAYNNAAALVADHNTFPGIDIAIFGQTINIIKDRHIFSGVSVLQQFEKAMRLWEQYCTYEVIDGATRSTIETIPKEAFREAIANALVHRTWDVPAHIRVSVFPDRVEVSSPGGLPSGISAEEYLSGRISLLRNPILGNLMFRLSIIERFGTGVTRIREAYRSVRVSPRFTVGSNSILVILPAIPNTPKLTEDEERIYRSLSHTVPVSSSQIAAQSGFGKSKVLTLLKELIARGEVQVSGTGRGTKYFL